MTDQTPANDDLDPARLERLLEDVRRLPSEIEPSRDAWPAIRQRIESQRVRSIAPAAEPARPRVRRSWWIAAAATVVIATGLTLKFTDRAKSFEHPPLAGGQPVTPSTIPLPTPPDAATPTVPANAGITLVSANPTLAAALDQYQQASRELETEVARHATGLSPATREVVRRSLATIDTAIADLRAALGNNPRDAALGQSLSLVYERKLEFLKRVRALPAAGM
jgi:hypothetical protein